MASIERIVATAEIHNRTRHQPLPGSGPEREALREKGQFWTPHWATLAMTSYIFLDGNRVIFDPAVGDGAFFRAAKEIGVENGFSPILIGREIDKKVLSEALKNNLTESDLAHVEELDFVLHPPQEPIQGIVANPPYIRHHRLSKEKKAFLRSFGENLIGKALDGRAGFHIYFLLRALQLLANNGRLAFIMPADTCEGVFAPILWKWITQNYLLECVVTFSPDATPFPSVDTNPIIFFIRRAEPTASIKWVRCTMAWSLDLKNFVSAGFAGSFPSLQVFQRSLSEALDTGLSRPPRENNRADGVHLISLASVMRGIATGENDFFFLTKAQAEERGISDEFLHIAVGRTRDVPSNEINDQLIKELDGRGRPTLLFAPDNRELDQFPPKTRKYLKEGIKRGLPQKPLISQRRPWYKMEERIPPSFLFAYLGRRNVRFMRNVIKALPLTCFLCVYPVSDDPEFVEKLWKALNHPQTLANLELVGKSYGDGALKVEPRSLEKLIIPFSVLEEVDLPRLTLF